MGYILAFFLGMNATIWMNGTKAEKLGLKYGYATHCFLKRHGMLPKAWDYGANCKEQSK